MSTKRIFALTAPVLGVALILGGCSQATVEPTPTTAPTSTETTAPAPTDPVEAPATETPAPLEVGVVLDRSPQDSELGPNQRVWNLDSGSAGWVVVDSTQPLPDVVKEDIAKPVAAKVADDNSFTYDAQGIIRDSMDNAKFAERQTGRKVLMVFATYSSPDAVNYGTYYMVVGGESNPDRTQSTISSSKEDAVAKIQAWIASQPDASSYDVIDATGGR